MMGLAPLPDRPGVVKLVALEGCPAIPQPAHFTNIDSKPQDLEYKAFFTENSHARGMPWPLLS
jgi:hypothetical protein